MSNLTTNSIYSLQRELPANLEMERMILGVILLDNRVAHEAFDVLSPDDMHSPRHRMIFSTMRQMWNRIGIDPLTLGEELNRLHPGHNCDPAFIASLFDGVPRFSSIASYVDVVKQKAILRRGVTVGNWMIEAASDPTIDLEEFLARTQQQVEELIAARQVDDLIDSEQAVERTLVRLDEQWASDGSLLGRPTGLTALDARLSGVRPGKMIIIAAPGGMGKTTLALNWLNSFDLAAPECAKPVGLFLTLEMDVEELETKLMSVRTGISTDRIEAGLLSDRERREVRQAAGLLATMHLEFVEGFARITANNILARVERVARKHGRIDFLVLDYIQLVDGETVNQTENDKLTEISRMMKRIALRFNIPVIVLSQMNRAMDNRPNKEPQLSDLRGSGSLGQDADIVIFIAPQDPSDPDNALRKLITKKFRGGRPGTDLVLFSGARSRYMNIEAPGPAEPYQNYLEPAEREE